MLSRKIQEVRWFSGLGQEIYVRLKLIMLIERHFLPDFPVFPHRTVVNVLNMFRIDNLVHTLCFFDSFSLLFPRQWQWNYLSVILSRPLFFFFFFFLGVELFTMPIFMCLRDPCVVHVTKKCSNIKIRTIVLWQLLVYISDVDFFLPTSTPPCLNSDFGKSENPPVDIKPSILTG
jgi:hypothetical protein